MAQVSIDRCSTPDTMSQTLLEQLDQVTETIRQRAFDLFSSRNGNGGGSDLEDWFRAEREVAFVPASELVENENNFQARIAMPGLDAKDIHVSAMPDALIVQGGVTHTHDGKTDGVRFSEFSEKNLFRRLDLPAAIDVDKVSVSLDKGILQVTAPKAVAKKAEAAN